MGIKVVHVFFISVCTLMFVGLALWRFDAWSDGVAGVGALAQAAACVLAAGGLVVYGAAFLKKMRGIGSMGVAAALLALSAWPEAAQACATCFGDPGSPLTKGMNQAILVLLGVIGTVLAAFAGTFLVWARRVRANRTMGEGMVH